MTDRSSRFTSNRRSPHEASWETEADWGAGALANVEVVDGHLVGRQSVSSVPQPDEGVAYWDFNGNADDGWGDFDGGVSGELFTTDPLTGDYVASFAGGGDLISVPDGGAFDIRPGESLSVALRFKPLKDHNYVPLVSKGDSSGGVHNVWDFHQRDLDGDGNANDFRFAYQDGVNGAYVEMYDIPYDEWHDVVGVFEQGLGVTGYLNGTRVGGDSANIAGWSSLERLEIGGGGPEQSGHAGYWHGSIDEIRIYDTALSESQVDTLYSTGTIGG